VHLLRREHRAGLAELLLQPLPEVLPDQGLPRVEALAVSRRSQDEIDGGRFRGSVSATLQNLLHDERRKAADPRAFEGFYSDVRQAVLDGWRKLRRVKPGPMRAKLIHRRIDAQIAEGLAKFRERGQDVTCRKGCSACCVSMPVHCSEDEADLIATLIRRGEVTLDADQVNRLEALAANPELETWRELPAELRACPFLKDSLCQIYEDRPFSCRKYMVGSPAEGCVDPRGQSIVMTAIPAEITASSAFNLEPGDPEPMAVKLKRRRLA
jgi:Fe-S-cluster containining protein